VESLSPVVRGCALLLLLCATRLQADTPAGQWAGWLQQQINSLPAIILTLIFSQTRANRLTKIALTKFMSGLVIFPLMYALQIIILVCALKNLRSLELKQSWKVQERDISRETLTIQ